MAKKNTTQILIDSMNRQNFLDELDYNVQNFQDTTNNDAFDATAKTASALNVALCINNLRDIEAQLFGVLGKSYTNTLYVAGSYMGGPRHIFKSVKQIQEYYDHNIALMIKNIQAEQIETQFIDDGQGQGTNVTTNPPSPNPKPVGNTPNVIYSKTGTWNTRVTSLLTNLTTLKTALLAYVPL